MSDTLNIWHFGGMQVHVHIKRYAVADLPETDDGLGQWCRDVFVAKAYFSSFMFLLDYIEFAM